MQDKKDLLLKKCRDLIYEEAFKMPYERVKKIYTDYKRRKKLNAFLANLIERGEFFYGDNFVKDFVNEKTDDARKWLLNDILYGNGIDIDVPDKKTNEVVDKPQIQKKEEITNTPKALTYDELLDKLTKEYNWPVDVANKFIAEKAKNENIREKAHLALNKENKSENLENNLEDEQIIPQDAQTVKPIEVKTKEPKPSLLKKFKEKWQDPSFRKKVIIGGVVMAVGIVAIALNPDVQQFLGDMVNNISNMFNGSEVTNTVDAANLTNGLDVSDINANVANLDTSSWNMEGMTVYDSANEAVNSVNGEIANQWFSNDIQGLYDTNTGQMLNLSPEELHNADYLKDLLNTNDNLSVVFGDGSINSLNDVSGFVHGDDVVNLIDGGRSR